MVGGYKDGELLCMATWMLLRVQLYPIMKNRFKQNQIQRKRTQNERLEEEIEDSDNWSRFIVLKCKEGLVPLTTKLSPFIIEKCIKGCAGEIKKKLKS